jgi:hypothetical protein
MLMQLRLRKVNKIATLAPVSNPLIRLIKCYEIINCLLRRFRLQLEKLCGFFGSGSGSATLINNYRILISCNLYVYRLLRSTACLRFLTSRELRKYLSAGTAASVANPSLPRHPKKAILA